MRSSGAITCFCDDSAACFLFNKLSRAFAMQTAARFSLAMFSVAAIGYYHEMTRHKRQVRTYRSLLALLLAFDQVFCAKKKVLYGFTSQPCTIPSSISSTPSVDSQRDHQACKKSLRRAGSGNIWRAFAEN